MTPEDIDHHLRVFQLACDEIMDEFPIADQQEARRREARHEPNTASF